MANTTIEIATMNNKAPESLQGRKIAFDNGNFYMLPEMTPLSLENIINLGDRHVLDWASAEIKDTLLRRHTSMQTSHKVHQQEVPAKKYELDKGQDRISFPETGDRRRDVPVSINPVVNEKFSNKEMFIGIGGIIVSVIGAVGLGIFIWQFFLPS